MYKIYDNFNNFIKCKNLKEVERVLLNYYNKELIEPIKIEGYENIDFIAYKYTHDYYGNPLYMIIIYDLDNRKIETIKSKQSYNIKETIKYILKNKY